MKELFEKLPKLADESPDYFLDTCFLYWVFEHNHVNELHEFCERNIVSITSFNSEEFIFHSKDVHSDVRVHFRTFVKKKPKLYFHVIPVSPGNNYEEIKFVDSIDPELRKLIPDTSDAVLIAEAINKKANVLTRDKHHLFTTVLEDYLVDKHIKVFSVFPTES
jgi:hypothetical protein